MEVVGGQAPQQNDAPMEASDSETTQTLPFGALLSQVPGDIRDISFATTVRGYDRREVDAYVERVNRVIAELEVSRSPQSAVKHALDRVGEQTSGVLQRAREVAEQLTATALAEADHATRRAKVEAEEAVESAQMHAHQLRGQSKEEADEILARASAQAAERVKRGEDRLRKLQDEAEQRLRALRAEIDAATDARHRLLEELRHTAARLDEFAQEVVAGSEDAQQSESDADPPTERMQKKTPARSPRRGPSEATDATPQRDGDA
jgi:DivIVA domain-containing protein